MIQEKHGPSNTLGCASRSRIIGFSIALVALSSALFAGACGPSFEDCRSRRACPGGQGGGTTSGEGGDANIGGASGMGGRTGIGGATPSGGTPGATNNGGRDGDAVEGDAGAGGAAPSQGAAGEAGEASSPGGCAASAKPPRLIAPLSTSLVTSRRPTVELDRGDDCGPLVVEFCSDRDCTEIIGSVELGQSESSTRPSSELPKGVVFWRARSGDRRSATWQFTVGRNTSVDTWWGTVPDFNGDGLVDVAVGSLNGIVHVYYGGKDGLGSSEPVALRNADVGVPFGMGLASVGDVNGDGFADLLVHAPAASGGAGSLLYLYWGSREGVTKDRFQKIDFSDYSLEPEQWVSLVLQSVARGGVDINGDGYGDFVVTAPRQQEDDSYRIFVGSGSAVLPGSRQSFGGVGPTFGRSFALCDLNGDRRTDMVVGAPDESSPTARSNVWILKASGARFEAQIPPLGGVASTAYGFQVACADFAGDGYPDIAASATSEERLGYIYGGGVALHSNVSGEVHQASTLLGGQLERNGGFSGWLLTVSTDMDGDDVAELVLGQNMGSSELEYQTVRALFSMDDPAASDFVEVGATADVDGAFGRAMTAGDVNGDGLADLVVSSPDYNGGKGRITIFRGHRTSRIVAPSSEHMDAPAGVTGFGRSLSAGL